MPMLRDVLCRAVLVLAALVIVPVSAVAQFRPASDPATGERYHVEVAGVLWNAAPTLIVSSEALGIPGDDVDLGTDLGIEEKRLSELRLVLRPARKHKFRLNYLPLKYEAQGQVQREFVFNGLRYRVGVPVNTTADLTTVRFGYEYDFLYMDQGYAGVLIDLKYTNVDITLDSPLGNAFVSSLAPIPTIGFTGRGYLVPNISITGEVSFFKVPEKIGGDEFDGRYVDYDFYGTVNFNDYFGAQMGYRSVHVEYQVDLDTGDLQFKGWYFGAVLRF